MLRGERTKFRIFLRNFEFILYKICTLDARLFVTYVRKKGVTVGEGTCFFGRQLIDLTRPHLVEIGRNCVLTDNVTILTHGYDYCVLREKYGEVLGSSGKVVIEDNVFIGARSIILKGVRIGKNSVIGAGSIVANDIPSNSLAAGNPCKVILTIDQYFEKRKKLYVQEAKDYALEIFRKTNRLPKREDFLDEFPIFLDRNQKLDLLDLSQLGQAIAWYKNTKPLYDSFEDFLVDSGIPAEIVNRSKKNKHQ